jgi:hypothetical protein
MSRVNTYKSDNLFKKIHDFSFFIPQFCVLLPENKTKNMSFSDFKTIEQVAINYHLTTKKIRLFKNIQTVDIPEIVLNQWELALKFRKSSSPEYTVCELLVTPVLMYAVSRHPQINIWLHERTITFDKDLTGTPDYLFSYRADPDNYETFTYPLVTVGDAKKEDFQGGWAQTLAEMVTCRNLNGNDEIPVYGIVCTGEYWQFGVLRGSIFYQNDISYSLGTSPGLIIGILDAIFIDAVGAIHRLGLG